MREFGLQSRLEIRNVKEHTDSPQQQIALMLTAFYGAVQGLDVRVGCELTGSSQKCGLGPQDIRGGRNEALHVAKFEWQIIQTLQELIYPSVQPLHNLGYAFVIGLLRREVKHRRMREQLVERTTQLRAGIILEALLRRAL